MKSCTACGQEIPDTARFCSQCGAPTSGEVIRPVIRSSPIMQQWRRLSIQLTRREARQLLGEPARVEMTHPASASLSGSASPFETWTYEYEVAGQPGRMVSGSVMLNSAEARVISWVEPDWRRLEATE